MGTLHQVEDVGQAKAIYESVHRDSSLWDGQDGPHESIWMRLKVSLSCGSMDSLIFRSSFTIVDGLDHESNRSKRSITLEGQSSLLSIITV